VSKDTQKQRAKARLHPNLDESINAIKLESGERRVFSCWRDARNHEAGVLLATDQRLIVAQSSGVYTLKNHGFLSDRFASRIPGIIMTSVDYSEMRGSKVATLVR
jgi:hypothetical protein